MNREWSKRISVILACLLVLSQFAAFPRVGHAAAFGPTISAGFYQSFFTKSDGTVWAWGANSSGQLGDGTTNSSSSPLQVHGLTGARATAVGVNHTLALKTDGTVWAWGKNQLGLLGDGTTIDRSTPVQVQGLSGVRLTLGAIAAGAQHSLAVKTDGTVWAWGNNGFGQFGDGTTNASSTPVQVQGLSGVLAVASGQVHSLALKNDGTVWAWGYSNAGLGDGMNNNSNTPVQVQGLTGVKAIASGQDYDLALKLDGTVWTWGSNDSGQLGDGTTTDRSTPVQVQGLNGVQAIAGGMTVSLALKSDGTVWAWGGNDSGQLGDGTTTDRSTPVQVQGLSDIRAIAAGARHSLAVMADDTVWAWGFNAYGQLGDSTNLPKTTPVKVLFDEDAVAADKASLAIWYAGGDSAAGATMNMTLPTVGVSGTTISWTSDNAAITVSGNSGVVTRPGLSAADVFVTLTATISKGAVSDTRTFTVTVKKLELTDTQAVAADKASLAIGYASGDSAPSVTQNVYLPTGGSNGTTISWFSSRAAIAVNGNDGIVTRPGYSAGDSVVQLTATVRKGFAAASQTFLLTVKKLPQTDAEAVEADKAALAIGYASGDSGPSVTQNVTLPTGGANGTTISWTSDQPAVAVNGGSGTVTRPGYSVGDAAVTLTATVSKGTASATRTFVLTVLAQKQTASGNVNLSGLTLSQGTLSPAFAAGTLSYTASVAHSVPAVTVTATVYDTVYATVTASVYNGAGVSTGGPFLLTSGAPSGSLPLSVGSNTIQVAVTAQDGTTQTYVVTVWRNKESSSGKSSPGSASPSPEGFRVMVNGKEYDQIAAGVVSGEGGKSSLTVTIVTSQLMGLLAGEAEKPTVVIPHASSRGAEKVIVALTGDAVKVMENKQAVLEVQTTSGNYKLPAAQIAIDLMASQLGQVSLSDIVVHVEIAKSGDEKIQLVKSTAEKGKFTVVLPPVEFTVTASYNGKTVETDKFSSYVEREIPLPEGIDPGKVTTAAVLEADGTVRHVPTYLTLRDGTYYAVVSSLTNSAYTIISHPVAFADMPGHWAQAAVNEMASRLVVNGVDETHFNPDAAITRAEFAVIIVRALGLAEDRKTSTFGDVNAGDWYVGAVGKALEFGLIEGYEDGTFRPSRTISREEALAMIARAMKLAGLASGVSGAEAPSALAPFADGAKVSPWARQAVAAAVKYGLVTGSDAGLQPSRSITRAETAAIVQRMLVKAKLIDDRNN